MTLKTRKPTGKPPWPILLIAGIEKSGKSYAAAAASASKLIGRTLWVPVGEDDPDELGGIDGARFEIVEHDGTWAGIMTAVRGAVAEPDVDGKPTLIVVDSMSREWDLLSDMAQVMANRREAKRQQRSRTPSEGDEVRIGMDLWNLVKSRHAALLDVLRDHDGPVLLTARLERTTIMDDAGQPTKQKDYKVKAEKSLVFDVGAVVMLPERGKAWITGVRSLRWTAEAGERVDAPDFTVAGLWERMGLLEDAKATAPRQWTSHDPQAAVDAEDPEAKPSKQQMAMMFALAARKLGGTEEPFKQWLANLARPYTGSRADLSRKQTTWIIEQLQQMPDMADPDEEPQPEQESTDAVS